MSSNARRHYSSPNIILATGKSARGASALGASATIKEEDEGEATISVSRSDGVHHDLLSVYARPGIASLVSSSSTTAKARAHSMDEGSAKSGKDREDKEEEREDKVINIARSDGLSHDIVKVFKASGDSARSSKLSPADLASITISTAEFNAATNANSSVAGGAESAPHTPATHFGGGEEKEKIKAGRSSTFAKIADLLTGKSREREREKEKERESERELPTRRSFTGLDAAPVSLSLTHTTTVPSPLGQAEYFLKNVRIVHMSDTHNLLRAGERSAFLPHGHILVHTGNFTSFGREDEFLAFNAWLQSVSDLYHYRVVLPGHRDVKQFGQNFDAMKRLLPAATHVLCHEECSVLGIRFYGVPWNFTHRKNYTVRFGAAQSTSSGRFDDIPSGLHVLLTHGPAYGRLDSHFAGEVKEHWGSRELAEAIQRRRPQVHLHGHVKDCRGVIPAFANNPLVVNGCVTDVDATVICAAPTVIKATQVMLDSATNAVSWSFSIDSLDG